MIQINLNQMKMKMILRIPHHHLIKMMKANLRQILKNKNLEVKSILAMMISIHLMELKSRKERMEVIFFKMKIIK
jgi:hypothetical protein